MKTILIYTSPARGHLYPMMDVAIELRKKGFNVLVQTLSSEKEHVEKEGIRHLSISSEIESLELQDYNESNPISQFKSAFRSWLLRAPLEIEDLKESCNKFKPDLLIVDVNTWGAGAFAESQKNSWVMFTPYCLPISSSDTPAFGPGFKPPTNVIHRIRDRVVDWLVQKAVQPVINELNQIRSSLQVSALEKYEDIFTKPDLVLYRTAVPFDYPRKNWPKNILPVGPGLWAPPGSKPEWIENLPSPRILVSISTEMQDDGAIIESALQALKEQQGSVIVTTAALNPDRFEAPRENVHITKFLPHAQVVPHMDLVVTHGGMGTTQRALAAGVPVCVISWGRDQSETARRVEVSGSGTTLPKNKLNEKRLRAAIARALNCKQGAKTIAQAFKEAGGARRAVETIVDLIAEQT